MIEGAVGHCTLVNNVLVTEEYTKPLLCQNIVTTWRTSTPTNKHSIPSPKQATQHNNPHQTSNFIRRIAEDTDEGGVQITVFRGKTKAVA